MRLIVVLFTTFVVGAMGACQTFCPEDYSPICAGPRNSDDDQTFSNQCALDYYNCDNKVSWKVKYEGKCCPVICPSDYAPVCGGPADSPQQQTFSNQCALDAYNCSNKSSWVVKSESAC